MRRTQLGARQFCVMIGFLPMIAFAISVATAQQEPKAGSTAPPNPVLPISAMVSTDAPPKPVAAHAPAKPEILVEEAKPDTLFQRLDIHWFQPSGNPAATLIIADKTARKEVFADEEWMRFAKTNHFCLLALGVEEAKGAPVAKVVAALEQKIFGWVDSHTRPATKKPAEASKEQIPTKTENPEPKPQGPVPVYFQSGGPTAFWLESIMLNRPARFAGWIVYGSTKFPEIPKVKDFKCPPGALVSVSLKQHYTHLEHFEDLRAANPANLISFASWEGKITTPIMDGFTRLIFSESAGLGDTQPLWLHLQNLVPHPADAKYKPDPTRYAWYPTEAVVGAVKTFRPAVLPKARPGISRRVIGANSMFLSWEFRWAKNVVKPQAILLFADTNVPASVFANDSWMDYAKKRNWGVMTMGLKEGQIKSYNSAAKFIDDRFLKTLDGLVGKDFKDLPVVLCAQGAPVYWMQEMVLRHPSRFKAWVSSASNRFPIVGTGAKVPPGLLYSRDASSYHYALYYFEDLRRSEPSNPVNLTPLLPGKLPQSLFDGYAREFIDASLQDTRATHRWLHLHELRPPSRNAMARPDPRQYAWFPTAELVGMWKTLRQQTDPEPLPIIAKRTFKTKVAEIPELNLFVRLPEGAKTGEGLKGVLCFCSWQIEDATFVNKLKSVDDYLVRFADRQNLAMITWNTANLLPPKVDFNHLTPEMEKELQNKYTVFGQTWHAGVKKICHEFKMEDKAMLLYGVSRGARFAHQISMRYPAQFLAVHTHIGMKYNPTIPLEAKHTLWLVTTGEVDPGYQDTLDFYRRAQKEGLPVLFKAGESLGHASRRDIEELSMSFFSYALNLRAACTRARAADRTFYDTPASLFQARLRDSPWIGDYINHQIAQASSEDLNLIPPAQRLALPTETIAKAWGMPFEDVLSRPKIAINFAAEEEVAIPKKSGGILKPEN